MKYAQFISAIEKMGTCFPIPNLGGASRNGRLCFFTVSVKDGLLYIRNNWGENEPYSIDEEFYNKVLERFVNAPRNLRFRVSYYTDPKWRNTEGNPSRIYAGYLPALFRELYTRTGKSVCDDKSLWNALQMPKPVKGFTGEKAYVYALDNLSKIISSAPLAKFINAGVKISKSATSITITKSEKTVTITQKEFESEFNLIFGIDLMSWLGKFLSERVKNILGDILKGVSIEIIVYIIKKCFGM